MSINFKFFGTKHLLFKSTSSIFFSIIIALLFVLAGGTIQIMSIKNYNDYFKQKDNYMSVMAVVQQVSCEYDSDSGEYKYDIDFSYDVDGETYVGHRYNSSIQYVVGDTLGIFYNQNVPSDYRIELPTKEGMIVAIILGVSFIIIGFAVGGISIYAICKKKEFVNLMSSSNEQNETWRDSDTSKITNNALITCPYCGSKMSSDSTHCESCGAKFK